MEIENIPELFSNKVRLSIIAALVQGEKSFNELKKITKASDGNLGAQLLKLETYGYVECTKAFVDRKPKTTYKVTTLGKSTLEEYIGLLEQIIHGEKVGGKKC